MSLASLNEGPIGVAGKIESRECKPDYQKMAATLKAKVDKVVSLESAIETSLESNILPYDLLRKEFTIFELVGWLKINHNNMVREYKSLLEIIEKENADGTK